MKYDYKRFDEIIIKMLEAMDRDPDYLEIGENISSMDEVKIIFDGYGYDEETNEENADTNSESYAIFIHKDTLTEDFYFPEHEQTPWCLVHRPKVEVCVYAWYNVENDSWDILPLEDRIDENCEMNEDGLMAIVEALDKKYFN